jgi:hypothetical protein
LAEADTEVGVHLGVGAVNYDATEGGCVDTCNGVWEGACLC